MSVLLGILLWLLLALLGLVVLVLITPVSLRVHLTNSPLFTYRVEVYAFGGLAPRLTLAKGPSQDAHPLPESVLLDLRPDFTRACLKGSMMVTVRVTVAAFLVPVLRFVWRAFRPGK